MVRWLILVLRLTAAALKSRRSLLFENLPLRHQLLVLRRTSKRPRLRPVHGEFLIHLQNGRFLDLGEGKTVPYPGLE
jgi:hypothetical protein